MPYQDYYYKTGFGGTVPIVSETDYNKVVAAGFTPFKQGTAETTTTQQTTPQATVTDPNQPPSGATRVGPTEFNQLREQYGVSPDNFDQYFWRDPNSPDIYKLSGLAGATPSIDEEIDTSKITDKQLSGTETSSLGYVEEVAGSSMTEFEKAILKIQQDRFRVDEETRKKEEEERDAARLGLEGAYDQPTGLELYKQFEEQAGLQAQQEALEDIMSQIAEIRDAATREQNRLSQSPYSTQFIMGRNRQITDKANADMASLVSAGEIVQNRIDAAERKITNYYNISIQDRQNEIDRRTMLYELEANDVIKLDDKEREANDAAIAMLESLNERQTAEKDAVTALMLQNPEAWAMAAGKLDLTAGYNEIAQQLVPYINRVTEQARVRTGGGGASPSTESTGFNQMIRGVADQLVVSRDAGDLTDLEYSSAVSALVDQLFDTTAENFDYNGAYNQVSSLVNTAMEGKPLSEAQGFQQETTPEEVVANPQDSLNSWFAGEDEPFKVSGGDTPTTGFLKELGNTIQKVSPVEVLSRPISAGISDALTPMDKKAPVTTQTTPQAIVDEYRGGKISYQAGLDGLQRLGYSTTVAATMLSFGTTLGQ